MRLLQALLGNHLKGNAAILGRYSCMLVYQIMIFLKKFKFLRLLVAVLFRTTI